MDKKDEIKLKKHLRVMLEGYGMPKFKDDYYLLDIINLFKVFGFNMEKRKWRDYV